MVKSGMLGYDKMLEEERRGGRPVNQLRTRDEDRRQTQQMRKKINPETPLNSSLQQEGCEFHNESDRCALKLHRQTGDGNSKY